MHKRTAPFLVALLFTSGCYSYRPAEIAPRGAEVRARLTTEAAVQRSAQLDSPVLQFDGRVVTHDPGSLSLDILIARDPSQFSRVEIRDTVVLARSELHSVMVRELSTSRTVLFIGALGVGTFAMVKGYQAVTGGAEGGVEDPRPEAILLPPHSGAAALLRRGITLPFPWWGSR